MKITLKLSIILFLIICVYLPTYKLESFYSKKSPNYKIVIFLLWSLR